MLFIPPETIEKARQVDLLSYLKAYEPGELVKISNGHYCTREHDSLKISNGKWYWFSRGFGGYNALDYLIKVNQYEVSVQPPPYGKDYNDYLCMRLGLPITHRKGKSQER